MYSLKAVDYAELTRKTISRYHIGQNYYLIKWLLFISVVKLLPN